MVETAVHVMHNWYENRVKTQWTETSLRFERSTEPPPHIPSMQYTLNVIKFYTWNSRDSRVMRQTPPWIFYGEQQIPEVKERLLWEAQLQGPHEQPWPTNQKNI